jgi:hypothetical protein
LFSVNLTNHAQHLWYEASHIAEGRVVFQEQSNVPLPLLTGAPEISIKEKCLLTLALVEERDRMERKLRKLKEMQGILGITGVFE